MSQCATDNALVGLDLSGRAYLKQARQSRNVVFSDFLFGIASEKPIVAAAYPVSAIKEDFDAVVVAGVNLELDVEDHGQSQRPSRDFRGADR